MNKNELIDLLSKVLIPTGFKRKGNYWVNNEGEIRKMVNLQKSNHGNFFYINYGYILNSIPLKNEMMHVYNRVSSPNLEERNRIAFLLNLDNGLSDQERVQALKKILEELVLKMNLINNEKELLSDLKKRQSLNDISLSVKNHFGLT